MEDIEILLHEKNKLQEDYEKSLIENEHKIIDIVSSSEAFKKLNSSLKSEYKCFISVFDEVRVTISYKLNNSFIKKYIKVSKEKIDNSSLLIGVYNEDNIDQKLIELASQFQKEFWNKD